jgi:hypothetical protein
MGRLRTVLPWLLLAGYGGAVWCGFVACEIHEPAWAVGFAALAVCFIAAVIRTELRR